MAALVEKVLTKEHAKVTTYAYNTQVYYLCTRPFYAVLGQADNRNRRERRPLTVKNKLIGLDFVLSHREYEYLATEQEKVDYFTGTLQVPRSCLPTKLYRSRISVSATARYFVDKYPIFLSNSSATEAPAVASFCFVDEGLVTPSHFETHLAQYDGLFHSLGQFRVVYVTAARAAGRWAEAVFQRFWPRRQSGRGQAIDPAIGKLLDYFAMRHLYDSKQFASFDRVKLLQLRQDREEFVGDLNGALYERWTAKGDAAVLAVSAPEVSTNTRSLGTFSRCVLEQNYDFFESLPAY